MIILKFYPLLYPQQAFLINETKAGEKFVCIYFRIISYPPCGNHSLSEMVKIFHPEKN